MNLCAEENVYKAAQHVLPRCDTAEQKADELHKFAKLLRGTGVDQTYHLTEVRDADLDKVDWPAVVEGVEG